jgi:hypothetical protein
MDKTKINFSKTAKISELLFTTVVVVIITTTNNGKNVHFSHRLSMKKIAAR